MEFVPGRWLSDPSEFWGNSPNLHRLITDVPVFLSCEAVQKRTAQAGPPIV